MLPSYFGQDQNLSVVAVTLKLVLYSTDPDQTAPQELLRSHLIWVYTVCIENSFQIFRVDIVDRFGRLTLLQSTYSQEGEVTILGVIIVIFFIDIHQNTHIVGIACMVSAILRCNNICFIAKKREMVSDIA